MLCVAYVPGPDSPTTIIISGGADRTVRLWDGITGAMCTRAYGACGLSVCLSGATGCRHCSSSSARACGGGTHAADNVAVAAARALVCMCRGHAGPAIPQPLHPSSSPAGRTNRRGTCMHVSSTTPWAAAPRPAGPAGEELACLAPHDGAVNAVATGPDGRLAASAGEDGKASGGRMFHSSRWIALPFSALQVARNAFGGQMCPPGGGGGGEGAESSTTAVATASASRISLQACVLRTRCTAWVLPLQAAPRVSLWHWSCSAGPRLRWRRTPCHACPPRARLPPPAPLSSTCSGLHPGPVRHTDRRARQRQRRRQRCRRGRCPLLLDARRLWRHLLRLCPQRPAPRVGRQGRVCAGLARAVGRPGAVRVCPGPGGGG